MGRLLDPATVESRGMGQRGPLLVLPSSNQEGRGNKAPSWSCCRQNEKDGATRPPPGPAVVETRRMRREMGQWAPPGPAAVEPRGMGQRCPFLVQPPSN